MGLQSFTCFCASALILCSVLYVATAETPKTRQQATNKISVNSDGKLKRQNEGGGEEVDLSTVNNQGGSQGGSSVSGQSPFGNNNPFLQQQPFFGNGLSFPGPSSFPGGQQPSFSLGQQPNFGGQQPISLGAQQPGLTGQPGFPATGFGSAFPQGFQGFPQGYPNGFSQGNTPFGLPGRNVILQNNGKQYLVQELTENQRVVQKNGKQYILQPYTGLGSSSGQGLQTFNVPNSAIADLRPSLSQLDAAYRNQPISSGTREGLAALFPPTAFSPATSGKLTSSEPHRLLLNGSGQNLQVEQFPIRSGQPPSYLSQAIGAVSAQLASQVPGQQYASQYSAIPFGPGSGGLAQAYSRANEAGYGLYNDRPADFSSVQGLSKRNAKGVSQEERKNV